MIVITMKIMIIIIIINHHYYCCCCCYCFSCYSLINMKDDVHLGNSIDKKY